LVIHGRSLRPQQGRVKWSEITSQLWPHRRQKPATLGFGAATEWPALLPAAHHIQILTQVTRSPTDKSPRHGVNADCTRHNRAASSANRAALKIGFAGRQTQDQRQRYDKNPLHEMLLYSG
jgi:hypothetical protein